MYAIIRWAILHDVYVDLQYIQCVFHGKHLHKHALLAAEILQ